MTAYADLYELPEDERIELVGRQVMFRQMTVGVAVEAEGKDGMTKANRYITKLKERFAGIVVEGTTFLDNKKSIVIIKVSPPPFSSN